MIKDYKEKNWADDNSVTDDQMKASDLPEAWIQAEDGFYSIRRE